MECPDCGDSSGLDRRGFVMAAGAVAAAGLLPRGLCADEPKPASEGLVKKLYESFTDAQKKDTCFDWGYTDKRGLLRSHVSNNWHITDHRIGSDFYTNDQKDMIEAIFWGLYNPDWHDRIRKQLKDDAKGYGKEQSIAIFGTPGSEHFEFVMTGRHLTIRCDGNTTEHVAFGGPIFYGHAAQDLNEEPTHPGNVFWPQAIAANEIYKMLDGKQRETALVEKAPAEREVHFRKSGDTIPGILIADLSKDQQAQAQKVLKSLIEPYRQGDQVEALTCLEKQGGLNACRLTFYKSNDVGKDGVWDVWRIEGPSFVWHYRGDPHVHVWVHVADDPSVKITTAG